jgi:dTDP-glucose 4,6-dehydratase
MKLLVTGGAGFIGSNFVLFWLQNHPQDSVRVIDALTYAASFTNLESVQDKPNFEFIKANITDHQAVESAMQDVDTVVHFAAETHVDRSIEGPEIFLKTNVLGTGVLLEAALKHQIHRFHHISTDEVFGSLELDLKEKFQENSPFKPSSPYSASKASSDLLVQAYYHTYGLPITISNCSNNYGPWQFPEKLIPLTILKSLAGQPIPVYGDGKNIRDWIHVQDHIRAVELILEKGVVGETYCVGGETERSNLQVVKEILKITQQPESLITLVPDRLGHDRRYAIDNHKIKTELGFKLQYDFTSGLEEIVKWYKDNLEWSQKKF